MATDRNKTLCVVLGICCIAWCMASLGADQSPLALEAKITLGDVRGRIDHLALDARGGRLFVAALGNNTVEVVDLKAGKVIQSISGLAEPQGVAYDPGEDLLYVANGNDGSLRMFHGSRL